MRLLLMLVGQFPLPMLLPLCLVLLQLLSPSLTLALGSQNRGVFPIFAALADCPEQKWVTEQDWQPQDRQKGCLPCAQAQAS